MKTLPNPVKEEPSEAGDALSLWVADRISGVMTAHGVPLRQQASLLGEVCALSFSQARRKLRGAVWSFNEVLAVVNHFGVSMDEVFSVEADEDGVQISQAPETLAITQQQASFRIGRLAVPCRVRIGARVATPSVDGELLTAEGEAGWSVGTLEQLAGQRIAPPYFHATQVLLTPQSPQPIRIAILDDEAGIAETLAEWFNASGYCAQAFNSCEQLLAAGVENSAAFIVDFMLADGDSSQAIIKTIRQALPVAPILLLTGKLRNGKVSESDLVTLLRTMNVSFFEKPVRPSVLAATIDKELDQLARGR